jgi:hypothetical protein
MFHYLTCRIGNKSQDSVREGEDTEVDSTLEDTVGIPVAAIWVVAEVEDIPIQPVVKSTSEM